VELGGNTGQGCAELFQLCQQQLETSSTICKPIRSGEICHVGSLQARPIRNLRGQFISASVSFWKSGESQSLRHVMRQDALKRYSNRSGRHSSNAIWNPRRVMLPHLKENSVRFSVFFWAIAKWQPRSQQHKNCCLPRNWRAWQCGIIMTPDKLGNAKKAPRISHLMSGVDSIAQWSPFCNCGPVNAWQFYLGPGVLSQQFPWEESTIHMPRNPPGLGTTAQARSVREFGQITAKAKMFGLSQPLRV